MNAFGQPLRLQEVPRPTRRRADDVVVRVAGAGVCHTDVHMWKGEWRDAFGRPVALPHILGHENVGWIEEAGEGAQAIGVEVGEKVILYPMRACGWCRACREGNEMLCAHGREPGIHSLDGGYAELFVTAARCAIPIPWVEEMPSVAPFADAGLTAYHAVKAVVNRLSPATAVGVVGIGGLGEFAVQLLKLLTQALVIAIDVDEERLTKARALGADLSVLSVDSRFAGALREVTGSASLNVMMDFVGAADTIQESMSALDRGGMCCVVGYGGLAAISSRQLVQGQLLIQGSLAGSYQDLRDLIELQRLGKIQSSYKTYPLESAGDVLQMLDAGDLAERAVLVPS